MGISGREKRGEPRREGWKCAASLIYASSLNLVPTAPWPLWCSLGISNDPYGKTPSMRHCSTVAMLDVGSTSQAQILLQVLSSSQVKYPLEDKDQGRCWL